MSNKMMTKKMMAKIMINDDYENNETTKMNSIKMPTLNPCAAHERRHF